MAASDEYITCIKKIIIEECEAKKSKVTISHVWSFIPGRFKPP